MAFKHLTAGEGVAHLLGIDNEVLAHASADAAQISLNVPVSAGEKALIAAIIVSTNNLTTEQQVDVQKGGVTEFSFFTGEAPHTFGIPIDFGDGNDVDVIVPSSGSAGEIVDVTIIGKIVKT